MMRSDQFAPHFVCFNTSHVEDPESSDRLPRLKEGDGYVSHRNTRQRLTFQGSMVSVAVNYQICSVTVNHLRESRGSEKSKNLRILALDGCRNWRIVQDNDSLGCAQLRQSTFEFQ